MARSLRKVDIEMELRHLVVEAKELLINCDGEDNNYGEGVLDLASSLAFPNVPLAVAIELFKTALAEHDKGEW